MLTTTPYILIGLVVFSQLFLLYLYLLSRANQVRIDDYYTIYYIHSLILNTTQKLFNNE